jgi:hypothetical protein
MRYFQQAILDAKWSSYEKFIDEIVEGILAAPFYF